jgi:hypothetical protein
MAPPDACADRRVAHAIGRSTRAADAVRARHAAHAIGRVVGVRRWPARHVGDTGGAQRVAAFARRTGLGIGSGGGASP